MLGSSNSHNDITWRERKGERERKMCVSVFYHIDEHLQASCWEGFVFPSASWKIKNVNEL